MFNTTPGNSRSAQQGWDRLRNGDLLNAAESAAFDMFVTADKNLRYQQQLIGRGIATCFAVKLVASPARNDFGNCRGR